jgi:hypothetical protein
MTRSNVEKFALDRTGMIQRNTDAESELVCLGEFIHLFPKQNLESVTGIRATRRARSLNGLSVGDWRILEALRNGSFAKSRVAILVGGLPATTFSGERIARGSKLNSSA